MVKFFIISSFVLLFFTTSILGGEVDKRLHQECLYPTIYVGKADRTAFGSGVIIRSEKVTNELYKNAFITCGHLVDENTLDYEVKFFVYEDWSQIKEIKSYSAVFYGANHELDLAVGFFYSDREMPIASLDFNPKIYIGNEVYRIGCGLGDEPRIDYGKLTLRGSKYRTSVHTVPGDSGSPLFHENKVIAIMISIRTHRSNMIFNISYAVPLSKFKTWDNKLAFIWDNTKPMPATPFLYLNFKNENDIKKK